MIHALVIIIVGISIANSRKIKFKEIANFETNDLELKEILEKVSNRYNKNYKRMLWGYAIGTVLLTAIIMYFL